MTDPTPVVDGFPGRDELESLLREVLPAGWADAVRAGDDDTLSAFRSSIDNPAIVAALGAAGWVAPHFAVEHGGRGLPDDDARAALGLLAAWEVPHVPRGSGLPLAAPTIRQWSTEETKRRLLPPLVTGEERWCQLFSEPGAGSDMASLATTAVRDGDEWIVNGQKVWTTFGHESEMAMLIARTDPDAPKHAGITYFGLDMRAAGVEVRPLVNIAGQLEFNEVFLTDVRVPDLNRISPVGEGWAAAMTTLGAERHALSGVRKKRKASDEILGGKPLAEVVAMAGVGELDSRRPRSPRRCPHRRPPAADDRAAGPGIGGRGSSGGSGGFDQQDRQGLDESAVAGACARPAWRRCHGVARRRRRGEGVDHAVPPDPREQHRGRHVGDPTQHRRRARPRAPPRTGSVQGRPLAHRPQILTTRRGSPNPGLREPRRSPHRQRPVGGGPVNGISVFTDRSA